MKWKTLKYKDILNDTYEVNLKGQIRNKKTKKELHGNSPKNEKGYIRVALQCMNGTKKYPLHRLIMAAFYGENDDCEVNHIDGNKENNHICNLEYVDRTENAKHAKENGLYQSCDNHYKASLSNSDVEKICKMISNGKSNRDIIRDMDLDINKYENVISKIRHRKCWKNISCKYKWNDDFIYKKYTKDDIYRMCECLYVDQMDIRDIIPLFSKSYDAKKLKNVLKKIKQGKLYKNIVNQVKRSTTIETKITS